MAWHRGGWGRGRGNRLLASDEENKMDDVQRLRHSSPDPTTPRAVGAPHAGDRRQCGAPRSGTAAATGRARGRRVSARCCAPFGRWPAPRPCGAGARIGTPGPDRFAKRRWSPRALDAVKPRAARFPRPRSVPHLALTKQKAAEALGVGVSHFERHVPCVYSGALRLFPFAASSAGCKNKAASCPRPAETDPRS